MGSEKREREKILGVLEVGNGKGSCTFGKRETGSEGRDPSLIYVIVE